MMTRENRLEPTGILDKSKRFTRMFFLYPTYPLLVDTIFSVFGLWFNKNRKNNNFAVIRMLPTMSVFDCEIVAAWMSWIDAKPLTHMSLWLLGRAGRITMPHSMNEMDEDNHNVFTSLPFHWMAAAFAIFLIMACKDTLETRLPELLQKMARMKKQVWSKWTKIFWGRSMAMCLWL